MVMWTKGHHKIGYSGGSKRVGWSFLCLISKLFSSILKVVQITNSQRGGLNIMAAQKFRTWKLYFIEPSVVAPNAVVNSESELSSIRQRFLTKKGDKS